MQKSLLQELDKDYLRDMGITVTGDIIAILKQAKKIQTRVGSNHLPMETKTITIKDTVGVQQFNLPVESKIIPFTNTPDIVFSPKKPAVHVSPAVDAEHPNVVANRTLKHFIQPTIITNRHSLHKHHRLEVPVPLRRRVTPEIEGRYKISLPKGTTPKTRRILELIKQRDENKAAQNQQSTSAMRSQQTGEVDKKSVFARLGGSEQKTVTQQAQPTAGNIDPLNFQITVQPNASAKESGPSSSTNGSSVFNRLGITHKRKIAFDPSLGGAPSNSANPYEDEDDDTNGGALAYCGVLKTDGGVSAGGPSKAKQARIGSPLVSSTTSTGGGTVSTLSKPSSNTTAGILSAGIMRRDPLATSVKMRLGVTSTVSSSSGRAQHKPVNVSTSSNIKNRIGSSSASSVQPSVRQPQPAPGTQKVSVLQRLGSRPT